MFACALARAEHQPYSRYQPIVDRQMFGAPPEGFDPTRNPKDVSAREKSGEGVELTPEQQNVKSSAAFYAMNVDNRGVIWVGFSDTSDAKKPVHHYLRVGDDEDGWFVKSADVTNMTMTVVKNDVEVELAIGGKAGEGKAAGGDKAHSGGKSPALDSLRARRGRIRQFRADEEKRIAEDQRRREEESRQREEERTQREAERAELRANLEEMRNQLQRQREESAKRAAEEASEREGRQQGEDQSGEVQP